MEGVLDMVPMGETALPVIAGEQLPVDLLGRQELVDQIMELLNILSSTRGSCTFALNGKWGSGKTFLLNMLERQLQEYQAGEKYTVFHYNCWEYDYYEEPLIAIVAAMLDGLDEKTQLIPEKSREAFKRGVAVAKPVLERIAVSFVKNKLGVDITDVISLANEVHDAAEEADEEVDEKYDYDQYYGFNKAMRAAKEELRKLTADKTVVVVVDELDRCLPSYAIKVLERLHHLFYGVDNMVVILAVDKSQMEHSVKQIFGDATDASAYLKKFINFELGLNTGKVEGGKFREKFSDYIAMFEDDNKFSANRFSFDKFSAALFADIDIRTQEHLMKRITTVHRMLFPNEKKDYSFMCFELMWVVFAQVHGLVDKLPIIPASSFGSAFRFRMEGSSCPRFSEYMNSEWKDIYIENRSHEHFYDINDRKVLQFVGEVGIHEVLLYYLSSMYPKDSIIYIYDRTWNLMISDRIEENRRDIKKINELLQILK